MHPADRPVTLHREMEWLYYVILVAVLLSGVLLNVFSLPGNWLMLLATLAYAWATGWRHVGGAWLVVLLVVAAAAEVVEFMAAGKGAKKVGGSIWGTIGALLGGLLGGIFLTALVPVPVVGTVVGILSGTFLGAAAAEKISGKEVGASLLIGAGAMQGRLYGTLLKLAAGILLFVLTVVAAFPW
jgi:uncharacterized protein YqgC (DUF456 family)